MRTRRSQSIGRGYGVDRNAAPGSEDQRACKPEQNRDKVVAM